VATTIPSPAAGDELGPYRLLSPIGKGGMGEVWRALDTRLDRQVAVKISKAEFTARFLREARMVASLNHPNICQLYDVGRVPAVRYPRPRLWSGAARCWMRWARRTAGGSCTWT
jgi:hypothetical protein